MAAGLSSAVQLTSAIRDGGQGAGPSTIPLVWDVDGAKAVVKGHSPVFSGPSLDSRQLYADDRDLEKKEAQTIEFRVPLKPDEEKTVTYKVKYTW